MVKLSSVRLDHEKELGIGVDYGAGIRFQIARWGSPRVQRYTEDLLKKFRSLLSDPHSMAAKQCVDNMIRLTAANRVLVGWENVDDDNGNPIPFSREKALETFEDPAYADILDFVVGVAKNGATYRVETDEEDLGN